MSIVLNENKWAEEMISACDIGNKPSETLKRVARYYIDSGLSGDPLRKRIISFLSKSLKEISIPKWESSIEFAIERAKKAKAVDVEFVEITKAELEKVSAVKSVQGKRLAFTLLCLAKFWKEAYGFDKYWVNCKDNEIMQMANVVTSVKRQGQLYYDLNQLGLVEFSKRVDSTNVRVTFVDDDSPTVIKIKDYRNLGHQYMMYLSASDKSAGSYIRCAECGIVVRDESKDGKHRQRYCRDCAIKLTIQSNVNSVMRKRRTAAKDGAAEIGA